MPTAEITNKTETEASFEAPKNFETTKGREKSLSEQSRQAVLTIEADQERIETSTDARIKKMPDDVGLDQETADSIFTSRGFDNRLKEIRSRIIGLAESTKTKVEQETKPSGQESEAESESESSRPQSLEEFMERHQYTGLEAIKEKARVAQLKMQGIKNPEKVLALSHYLEENVPVDDSQSLKFEKAQMEKAEKEAQKLRNEGYEVKVEEDYSDDKQMRVWAHKETKYLFSASGSKDVSKNLDELLDTPNDPIIFFETLRNAGYKIKVAKARNFSYLYDNGELNKLFRNQNTVPFLEKLRTFGGLSMTHDYFKDYDSLRKIAYLAEEDAAGHLLTPESEKGVEKVSVLLGKPVNFSNLESWAKLSQDGVLMEIFSALKQEEDDKKSERRYQQEESQWLRNLSIIKDAGIENEMSALLKDEFLEKSFGKIYGWGELSSAQAAKNIKEAATAFKDNSSLYSLVRGVSKIYGIEDSFSPEKIQKFKQLVEMIPEVGPAFSNLADLGVQAEYWGEYLGDPDNVKRYREVFKAVAEPEFKVFTNACKEAGYNFEVKDLFSSFPKYNRLILSYRDEEFRSAITSETGQEIAKYLGFMGMRADSWNPWGFKRLVEVPGSLQTLKKFEESYNFKYDPKNDYANYQLGSILSTLENTELLARLFEPKNVEVLTQVGKEFDLKFTFDKVEETLNISQDPNFRATLQDPEAVNFIKSGLKENNKNMETLAVLAKCDPSLRPAIIKMTKEFGYIPVATRERNYKFDSVENDNFPKYELALYDIDKFEMLRDMPEIFEVQRRLEAVGLKKNPLDHISDLKKVAENGLITTFEQCKNFPRILLVMWGNLELAETMSKLSPEKMSVYLEIFQKIADSPSQEIQRLKDSLLGQLLESQHPVEDYQTIESIFIKNNIPTVGKVYGVFETLYNQKSLAMKIGHRTSPVLKQASSRKRYYTIYQDLLKIHIESGNRSLKEYSEVLQRGGRLIDQYEQSGVKSLSGREQEELLYFVGKLETLLAKSALDTAEEAFKAAEAGNLEERIKLLRDGLKVSKGQTILERVSEMYLRPAGLKSFDELLKQMHGFKDSADRRGRQIVADASAKAEGSDIYLELKGGDFLKGVDARHIGNILQNGSVAREFLGANSDSDATPLDTDISLVTPEDAKGGFSNSINQSLTKGYGDLIFALKDRGQYQLTEIGKPVKEEPGKMELFKTGVLGEKHFGIRTGLPATEIDFMIAQDNFVSHPQDLEDLFFEIAQNGYYVPIADTSGKVIFTPEMFDDYRKPFSGLEKFDAPPLNFSPTTSNERSYRRVSEIATSVPEDSRRVDQATGVIRAQIERALGGLGVNLRPDFDTSILGAELLDTGSTGRHTNTPGDFDFDFSLKLDSKDFPRADELAQAIKNTMIYPAGNDNSHQEAGGYYQLRLKGVTAIGGQQLEKPLDIDIGFANKSDLSAYGSHDAIRDKLNYIKGHGGQQAYEQTIANVILTKQTLKEGHAYKKQEDGGFGGVGVENWILANGGNMEMAFRSFRDASFENGQRLPYERFKEKYKLLDPGVNIKFNRHDNFINVLKPNGYEAMLNTIENYLNKQAN